MILKDLIMDTTCEKYKYHAFFLFVIDASYLAYRSKMSKNDPINVTYAKNIEPYKKSESTSTDPRSNSVYSLSLSSEINDYKITHDLSTSDADTYSLFSTSENSDKKIVPIDKKEEQASIPSINLDSST